MIPYTTQWQKITEAYMRGEIKPYDAQFCFCGTLADGSDDWAFQHTCVGLPYSYENYLCMEWALLWGINKFMPTSWHSGQPHPDFEDALFQGMCDALEVLRRIHIKMGDETAINFGTPLQKRELCPHPTN